VATGHGGGGSKGRGKAKSAAGLQHTTPWRSATAVAPQPPLLRTTYPPQPRWGVFCNLPAIRIDDKRQRKCRSFDAGYLIQEWKALSHTLQVSDYGLCSTIRGPECDASDMRRGYNIGKS
jgi:hypothetical protein